jgi:hypothetical protein
MKKNANRAEKRSPRLQKKTATTKQTDCRTQTCRVQGPKSKGQSPEARRPAAVDYLSRFLCVGLVLGLLGSGCAGPRPLKGGKAVTTHKPAGVVEQTLVQGENPSQATKQDQEAVKVRSYTVPAGSRVEQSSLPVFHEPQCERNDLLSLSLSPSTCH